LTPVAVSGLSNATAIATGGDHTCALVADGTVRCWGANDRGQLGDGTTTNRSTPVAVQALRNAVAITAGLAHTCASLADGTVRCWGANDTGELGDDTTTQQPLPDTVIGLTNAGGTDGGGGHSCAITAWTAACWGANDLGQLGDNTTTQRLSPVFPLIIASPQTGSKSVVQIAAGSGHSCALLFDGSLQCWGEGASGQLGGGTLITTQLKPVVVPSFTLNIDPAAVLGKDHRSALVKVIASCRRGQRLHVTVSLRQRRSSSSATGDFKCVGRLSLYPLSVRARGRRAFTTAAARASAQAVIRNHGAVIDRERWTRAIKLSSCASVPPGELGSCRPHARRGR
jgi:alpha-tubulin suppressor-like RCC1 family protein